MSTDHQEIANVSRRWGAQVIQRPAELATAQSPTEPCLIHAVRAIEARRGHPVDVLVLLQPTSPLRGAGRIDQAVRLLVESGCDSVASVVKDIHYYFLGELGPQSELKVGYDPNNRLRTQDIPPRYRENGAIYVMTREQLMDRGCRMGGDLRALVMDETESVDIDTMLDLQHCELLLPRTSAGELVRPATVETPALTAAESRPRTAGSRACPAPPDDSAGLALTLCSPKLFRPGLGGSFASFSKLDYAIVKHQTQRSRPVAQLLRSRRQRSTQGTCGWHRAAPPCGFASCSWTTTPTWGTGSRSASRMSR